MSTEYIDSTVVRMYRSSSSCRDPVRPYFFSSAFFTLSLITDASRILTSELPPSVPLPPPVATMSGTSLNPLAASAGWKRC